MFGQSKLEVMQYNELLLISFGKPVDELAARVARGPAQNASPALLSAYPAGAVVYGTFDFGRYMGMLKSFLPAEAETNMPSFAANMPQITFAGYHQDGKGYYRMQLPRAMVASFVEKAKEAKAAAISKSRPPAPAPAEDE